MLRLCALAGFKDVGIARLSLQAGSSRLVPARRDAYVIRLLIADHQRKVGTCPIEKLTTRTKKKSSPSTLLVRSTYRYHPDTQQQAMAHLTTNAFTRRFLTATARPTVNKLNLSSTRAALSSLAQYPQHRSPKAQSSLKSAAPLSTLNSRQIQTAADSSAVNPDKIPSDDGEKFKITLDADYYQTYKCDAPSLELEMTKAELVQMYRWMVTMRRMEMAADALYKQKMIRGFCHLAIGQEAVSVGMESAIKPDDKVITAYRCHPFAVLRGGTIKGVIAELLGRKDGMSSGKGGSMHIFTPTFFGGNGIVGAQVPVGAGIALAQKYLNQDDKHATFIMYGDGASNQGQVFEAFNMAKLWNLPAVFVCENNLYGMGTSAERSSSNTKYFTRGDQIPGLQANGMDVLSVHNACKYAKEWTTSGKGPLLLEFITYRYGGHSMSDPGTTYRSREEIQHMRSTNDPITGLRNRLLEWNVIEEAELKAIDKQAKAEVDVAVEEAKKSPEPNPETDMWTDIYYKGTAPKWMRGREKEEVHRYKPEECKDLM
ncbi:alpha subunit of pyruvate dehydrogenase [Puccinia graminis f. sp. tritici]|uniref:Pyruvate dehydrogenase E1 component subunit alpha n=2 Tax=Puccinia graminis f. sp. tritici TaxID=56615 RepID=A0A5B0LSE2_PUCGR|nr:alpha subunit of pyruvate dehydrogenase [Puccinia graminis f. sp. tritici]